MEMGGNDEDDYESNFRRSKRLRPSSPIDSKPLRRTRSNSTDTYSSSSSDGKPARRKPSRRGRRPRRKEPDTDESSTESGDDHPVRRRSRSPKLDPKDELEIMRMEATLILSKTIDLLPRRELQSIIDAGRKEKKKTPAAFRPEIIEYSKMLVDKLDGESEESRMLQYIINARPTESSHLVELCRSVNNYNRSQIPLKARILNKKVDVATLAVALEKYESMSGTSSTDSEHYKMAQWINGFLRIPFGTYCPHPVNVHDNTLEECGDFLLKAERILDDAIYGQRGAKCQILQYIAQLITNPDAAGNNIAIYGDPGVGKTSLIQNGVSRILDRPFHFISLGGATDEKMLTGHGYTYEGAIWGRIADILMRSECMNPIIYFDELDKIPDNPAGHAIAGLLTHLIDPTQNYHFHDNYFTGLDLDLSRVLFIFSYNNKDKIDRILLDRMYNIEVESFSSRDKIEIARDYLIPRTMTKFGMDRGTINFTDDVINHIISITPKESGVRNLIRSLENIVSRLNIIRMVDTVDASSSIVRKMFSVKINTFTIDVTKEMVDHLISTDRARPRVNTIDAMYL